ncbi:MAG: glycosyl hydrolase [Acidobacteria bacterium]|nr:glycosyl hydrolase [Acidobacteriota bacterium]
MHLITSLLLLLFAQRPTPPAKPDRDPFSAQTFLGLRLRSIGPALSSGRVTSFAVDPRNHAHYYVGVASGGVWKTTNAGITFTPVFDNEGSYSIGHVALDPRNPSTVWAGAGENNSQRSVGYGDGVYRSDDGGRTWGNMGLKASEHIGRVLIDPRNSDTIFVAAQGPLWGSGGDRGLFKSTDGGKTWKNVLSISENTGVTDVALSPHNPDFMLAASWQRRRHVWTLINGGPESALYKSRDGGNTWTKVRGLPTEDLGRIGLAFSPAQPCLAYARVEIASPQSAIFRSTDCGESWERRGNFDGQGMYYGQIIADPADSDRVYLGDVRGRVSDDGGRTLRQAGDRSKHPDTHTYWIDPGNSNHLLSGCDGGVYESYDRAQTWRFLGNIPTMQFYDVTVDNSAPFYYVYGGTQDNFSVGGPSRTRNASGIVTSDWFVTQGGDGFHSRVDPSDSNIVYSVMQYGGIIRYDRRTRERTGIRPVEGKGEPPLRWNWDSPLIVSPHSASRIYFAANKLFRSDDRGGAWRAVSPDLTRQLDRDALPVMGRIWGPDSVAKHQSTSFYGNLTALAESPGKEGLLYAGTDDGLIQISENGGSGWRKTDSFPGVPERTFVTRILPSQHDDSTVYALFNNHKNADFKPYVLKSKDRGVTWTAIQNDLPAGGPVWAIAEDHVNPDLLFVGTEFGLYFTINGGQKWIRLRGGLPTIAVRDLAIQKRENDLALATFGRGFYILDDYTPLRLLKPETLEQEATLFAVKNASIYIEAQPIGGRGKAFQGEAYFTAENPPFGAVFTYFLKETLRTKKQQRQEAERQAVREKQEIRYPSREQLSKEDAEEAPAMILTITDSAGKVVRRLNGPAQRGFQRVAWNLRTPPPSLPAQRRPGAEEEEEEPFRFAPTGHLVAPGAYRVSIAKRVDGVLTPLSQAQSFQVQGSTGLQHLSEFQQSVLRLQRAVNGATENLTSAAQKMAAILRALDESNADPKLRQEASRINQRLRQISAAVRGDEALRRRQENLPVSINERVQRLAGNYRMSTATPLKTDQDSLRIAGEEMKEQLAALRAALETDLKKLEKEMEAAGAPHTPGRIPDLR